MSDACKTMLVTLQENGIIRSLQGFIIGRIELRENIKFALSDMKPEAEKDEAKG